MKQTAANAIMPTLHQVGDIVLDYPLSSPEFYMSYASAHSSSTWYYQILGYSISFLLIGNFILRTYKAKSIEQCNNHFTG
jgi:hypothetical protein